MSRWDKWFGFSRDEVFDEALSAYDRGDFENAVEGFERCQRDCSDSDDLRLARFYLTQSLSELGHERLRAGDAHGALAHFDRALNISPNYPDLNLAAAKACRELGLVGLQDHYLATALSINPRHVDAILFQGLCWYEQGRYDESLARLNYACQVDPNLDMERYMRVLELHAQGDHAAALRHLLVFAGSASADAYLHIRVGDSFLRDHRLEEALAEFRKAVELSPEYADAHCRLGKVLLSLGQSDEAAEHLQRCLELNDSHAEAHAQLGLAFKAMRKPFEAKCEIETALKLDPNHPVRLRTSNGYVA